jgi:hypothetical protein
LIVQEIFRRDGETPHTPHSTETLQYAVVAAAAAAAVVVPALLPVLLLYLLPKTKNEK